MTSKASERSHGAFPKKVYIVEDHPVFREGLAQIIKEEQGLEVCGAAGDAVKARREVTRLKPDLILVDISLPGKSGLELIKEIRASDTSVKVLVVSMHDEALYANRVLRLGGDGYIMKQEDPSEIVHAIQDVLNGHIYVSEEVLARGPRSALRATSREPQRPLDRLSDLELEVLELLGQGKTNQEIARAVRCSAKQVASSCAAMRKKLDLASDNALIRYAVTWIETGKA
jgi:DNA-binding NarL/FixJ family response regulator